MTKPADRYEWVYLSGYEQHAFRFTYEERNGYPYDSRNRETTELMREALHAWLPYMRGELK